LPQTAREPSARVPVPPGAAIFAAGGLLLALTALLIADGGGAESPSVRLSVHVPDLLLLAAATAFALTALVVTWILVSRSGRRLEGDNELLERYRRFLALPWWMQVLLRLVPILPLIAIVSILAYAWPGLEESFLAFSRRILTPLSDGEATVPAIPVVSLPWLGWLLGLVGLVAGLASLAVALVLLFAERIADWLERRNRLATAAPLREAVEESLDDLAGEPDLRTAVIRCYRRFERFAAQARVPRAPWQTSSEFVLEALARLALPRAPVEQLTRLFELARFSDHPLEPGELDRARGCLEEIRAALEPEGAARVGR
jgi:Domain of unknown function (DUF4129)